MKHSLWLLLVAGCLSPSSEQSVADETVGVVDSGSIHFYAQGQALVRHLSDTHLTIRAATPEFAFKVRSDSPISLTIANVTRHSFIDGDVKYPCQMSGTICQVELPASTDTQSLRLTSAFTDEFSFVLLSDVQQALPDLDRFVTSINQRDVDFVISTGDIFQNGSLDEYEAFFSIIEELNVPFYATVGNHELPYIEHWREQIGPHNVFFDYQGVAFSLLDSSNATIDPVAISRFEHFAEQRRDVSHFLFTHIPFFDPAGLRSTAFRNRNEAAAMIERSARADIDALFFGHLHSYYEHSYGGIDAYISGGGGALPEQLDGIGEHYLVVNLKSQTLDEVRLIPVDEDETP